jgi:hypothetical protein
MNALSTLLDDAHDFCEPHFDHVKDWFVCIVKRAIDENVQTNP